jgi:hypothetical protein
MALLPNFPVNESAWPTLGQAAFTYGARGLKASSPGIN